MSKPAARIGDMHVCPMCDGPKPHVGGPILPVGVPTVLIGGLPAATVTSQCVCVSPAPDVIVQGSLGVFIGGKPAARLGDKTAHGGTILSGCPTVLIGDLHTGAVISAAAAPSPPCAILSELQKEPTTKEEKQRQAELQQQLEEAFYDNLQNIPEDQRQDAFNTLNHYQQTADAADMARLSQAAYGGKTPLGFERVEGDELSDTFGIQDTYLDDENSGFRAAVFRSTTGGDPEYTVAYAGTDPEWGDIKADLAQGVGMQNEQYDRALMIGANMKEAVGAGGFRTTGHSLGGGLASATSATTGAQGATFNSAGLHPATTRRENGVSDETRAANERNVDAYYNSRDPLNFAQDRRTGFLAGIGAAASWLGNLIGGPIGGAIAGGGVALLGASGALPKAYGNRIEVPAESSGLPTQHGIGDMIELLNAQAQQDLEELKKYFGC